MLSHMLHLFRLEWQLEFRKRESLYSVLLYLLASVYLSYLVFQDIIDADTWNALFWLLLLFTSLQAATRSFNYLSGPAFIFYYQHCHPREIILSKMAFQVTLMTILAGISWGIFTLFLGNPVEGGWSFLLTLFLGAMGFASILSLMAAIAARSNNNMSLMAVLGLPLLMPLVLSLVRISTLSLVGAAWADCLPYFGLLALLNCLIGLLSFVLFPYIWQE